VKNLNNVEANAILLLKTLEHDVAAGHNLSTKVVLQMCYLKQALEDSDEQYEKDLEKLYKQTINSIKN
jgi:hypothetical protein